VVIADQLLPCIVNKWRLDGNANHAVPSGQRNAIFSGYSSQDYAELCHFDDNDNGLTLGLRSSHDSLSQARFSYAFVQPEVRYSGLKGLIAEQGFGTFTVWNSKLCEHTSSVDPVGVYFEVENRVPSIGVVAAQNAKLLSLASKKSVKELENAVYWDAFRVSEI